MPRPLAQRRRRASTLARRRLDQQRLTGTPYARPEDVVAGLLAVQSQDFAGAKWAVAQRARDAIDADVQEAFQAGRILRTTNGGQSWSALLGVDTDNLKGLNDVFFQDESNGWIVGNGGLILRTVNGGASWVRVLPGVTVNDLERVSFPRFTTSGGSPAGPTRPFHATA